MRRKIISWIFAIVLLAALLPANTHALGITPGRTVMNFEEGKEKEVTLTILNNENKGMKVMIYLDESMADIMKFKPIVMELESSEPSKDFTFGFKMPEGLSPGMNEIKIRVMELPAGYGEEDAARITATMELIHQLRINVPYPGKYAESDVYINSNDAEKPVLFTIPIFNRGKEKIERAKAIIEIYDVDGNKIVVIETDEISLESGKEGKVTAELSQKLGRGRYKAVITLDYDGETIRMEKEFFVGIPTININSVIVDSAFRLGGIAKFSMLLENMWNQRIEGIFGDIKIKDSNNREVGRFKTASTDIDANSIGKLDAYWDTKEINPGLYRMSIALNYINLVNEKIYDMEVGFDSINIREYGATGAVVAAKGAGMDRNVLLGAAVFILVVANIALLLYFRSKMRGPKNGYQTDSGRFKNMDNNDYERIENFK